MQITSTEIAKATQEHIRSMFYQYPITVLTLDDYIIKSELKNEESPPLETLHDR